MNRQSRSFKNENTWCTLAGRVRRQRSRILEHQKPGVQQEPNILLPSVLLHHMCFSCFCRLCNFWSPCVIFFFPTVCWASQKPSCRPLPPAWRLEFHADSLFEHVCFQRCVREGECGQVSIFRGVGGGRFSLLRKGRSFRNAAHCKWLFFCWMGGKLDKCRFLNSFKGIDFFFFCQQHHHFHSLTRGVR